MSRPIVSWAVVWWIGAFGVIAEAATLWMFSLYPINTGFPPDTNPVLVWFCAWALLVHYPIFFVPFSVDIHQFWPLAFIIGYTEITLGAIVIYYGARRALTALKRMKAG